MHKTKQLMDKLFHTCESESVPVYWFNVGLHVGAIEVYTAQECDEWAYVPMIGDILKTPKSVESFVKKCKKEYEKNVAGGLVRKEVSGE